MGTPSTTRGHMVGALWRVAVLYHAGIVGAPYIVAAPYNIDIIGS
jgi:hypothetical protein